MEIKHENIGNDFEQFSRENRKTYRNMNVLPAQSVVDLLWRKIDADCCFNVELPSRYDQLSKVSIVKISLFANSPLNYKQNQIVHSEDLSYGAITSKLKNDFLLSQMAKLEIPFAVGQSIYCNK